MENRKKIGLILAFIILTISVISFYTLYTVGDHLKSAINITFVIGIFLIILASSIAVFQSGSFHLFLAGFNKKIKEEVIDNIRSDVSKQTQDIQKQRKEQKKTYNLVITIPLFWGLVLVISSFVLSYLFY